MPKININEKDRTSPGTSNSYANYSVLIAGFSNFSNDELDKKEIKPLETINVEDKTLYVYEFSSQQDFEDTIGLVAPDYVSAQVSYPVEGVVNHYGNQMAYELLGLGYPVIYLNLGQSSDNVEDIVGKLKLLSDSATWEIFKDRATFDFRFVTHGLLTSGESINNFVDAGLIESTGYNEAIATTAAARDNLEKAEHTYKCDLKAKEIFTATYKDASGNKITDEADLWKKIVEAEKQYVLQSDSLWKSTDIIYFSETAEEVIEPAGAKVAKTTRAAIKPEVIFTSYSMAEDGINARVTTSTTSYSTAFTAVSNAEKAEADKKQKYLEEVSKKNADTFYDSDFNNANYAIANLAMYKASAENEDEASKTSGRGDCVALIEVDESKYVNTLGSATGNTTARPEIRIIDAINEMSGINADNGKFCAITVPSVYYNMDKNPSFSNNVKFPAAFHYLACFKYSQGIGFAEWYATAGYTRGISSYVIDRTSVKLGEVAINALEPRYTKDGEGVQPVKACNVIANFRGSYYLWGNRTAHPIGSYAGGNDLVASHFLNIRQLCITIKKQLYVACRRFTFDPNSDTLWVNFCSAIRPTLDRMKADQGVRDYKIVKVFTDKKATLKAKIRIIPIEAVEDFILEVSLEDSFGETTATVTE